MLSLLLVGLLLLLFLRALLLRFVLLLVSLAGGFGLGSPRLVTAHVEAARRAWLARAPPLVLGGFRVELRGLVGPARRVVVAAIPLQVFTTEAHHAAALGQGLLAALDVAEARGDDGGGT